MNSLWLVSYIILWLVVFVGGLAFLALAREIEVLHGKLETLTKFLQGKPPHEN